MPHDAKGRELNPGDTVMVPFKVLAVYQMEYYCNADLETVATMPPEHKYKTRLSAVNTCMTVRANLGDNTSFETVIGNDGIATRLSR